MAADWPYHRELTFDRPTPTGESVVAVELSPQMLGTPYAHFQPDGEDLRFTLPNQTQPLDYWVESWNPSGKSRIWVKVPEAGAERIWMRYGNTRAQSASNGSAVFDFYDDFNDGIWRKHTGNPVLSSSEPWEARAICEPTVLYEDGVYKMWYMGCATSTGTNAALGYATSANGLDWTKSPDNPILKDPTEAVIRTTVVKSQGTYYLFASDYQWNNAPGNIRRWTSGDGIHWTDKTIVLRPTQSWENHFHNIDIAIDEQGTWHMLYTTDGPMGYAHSTDGLNWTKHAQPVITGFYGGDPYLAKIGDTFYVWHSQASDGELLIYGRKSCDMIHWEMIGNGPQLGYTQPWERGIGRPEVHWNEHLTDAELMEHDGRVWMYYQGSQNPLGVAWFDGTMEQLGEALANPPMQQWAPSHFNCVEDNQLKVSHNATNNRPLYVNSQQFSDQEGYVVQCQVRCYAAYTVDAAGDCHEGGTSQVGVVMRYVDQDNLARFRLVGNQTTYYEERIEGKWSTPIEIGANGAMIDQWSDLVVVIDGDINKLYIDGRLIGTATSSAALTGRTDLMIGVSTQDAFAAFDNLRVLCGNMANISVTVGTEVPEPSVAHTLLPFLLVIAVCIRSKWR